MTKIQLICFIIISFPGLALAQSSGLKLQGHVPLRAKVQIVDQAGQTRVDNQSSKELKFEITRRSPASLVTVSAP